MLLRFIKYNIEVIEHYLKGKAAETRLPFILNICLYHGKINKPYPLSDKMEKLLKEPYPNIKW